MGVRRTEEGVLIYSSRLLPHDNDYHEGSAKKGIANGVAGLDASAKLPAANNVPEFGFSAVVAKTGVADYLTTDYASDDACIQAAINHVSGLNNGHILIKEGTYTLLNAITINSNNIMLSGVQGTILTASGAIDALLKIGNTSYTTSTKINNIRFNCDNNAARGIIINGAQDLNVSDCEILAPTTVGIHLIPTTGSHNTEFCRFYNMWMYTCPISVHFEAGASKICADCIINGMYIQQPTDTGILIEDCNKIMIMNAAVASSATYNTGIKVIAPKTASGASSKVYGTIIENYVFESHVSPYAIGIHILTVTSGNQINNTQISNISAYPHENVTMVKLETPGTDPNILNTTIDGFLASTPAANANFIVIADTNVKSTRIGARGSMRDTLDACINDGGFATVINGIGKKACGADTPPTVANWEIGDIIKNTSDNSIWVKDSDTVMRMLSNVPIGNFTAPSVPATTVNYTNPHNYSCQVQIYGGTVTEIDMDDIPTGLTSGLFTIPPNGTINITYSASPSWRWWGL